MRIEQICMAAQSFADLETILDNAKPQISFFGKRYLSSAEHDGTMLISQLMDRMIEIRNNNIEFNEDQRQIGKRVYKKIYDVYHESYKMIDRANIITRILNVLRQIFCCGEDNFDFILWDYAKVFNMYTYGQFLKVYGRSPEEAEELYYSAPFELSKKKVFNGIDVWVVSESYKGPNELKVPDIICGPPEQSYYGYREL